MPTKYEKYSDIKQILESNNVEVKPYKEINYGVQFEVYKDGITSKIRIYESKKGIKLDLSMVKDLSLKEILGEKVPFFSESKSSGNEKTYHTDKIEVGMIGIDESGKGDYFGPLVVAGVYADKRQKQILQTLGVMDSKKLNDKKIAILAKDITAICPFDIVCIGNEAYNRFYDKIQNLNRLLAWGHARVIENMLQQVECEYALSDQFGNEHFIENALMEKGKNITLEQRTKAEQNVVVAAASILARDQFVRKINEMQEKYEISFPKGASSATITAAKAFVLKYGKEALKEVAKLHFKTTNNI